MNRKIVGLLIGASLLGVSPALAQNNLRPVTVTSLAATGNLFSVDTWSMSGLTFQLGGTWVGTVTFESSDDNTNWVAQNVLPSNSATEVTTATAPGAWWVSSKHRYFRARVSAYTSGTITGTAFYRF